LGRKRSLHFDLPPLVQRKGKALYYVRDRQWTPLGSDRLEALKRYAAIEGAIAGRSVWNLLDEYFIRYLPANPIEASTERGYKRYADTIRRYWGADAVSSVNAGDAQRFYDFNPKKAEAMNTVRFFKLVMGLAVGWDWVPTNPLERVRMAPRKGRKVTLTADQMDAVRAVLSPPIRIAVDIAYLCAARVSEVCDIQLSDIRDGVLHLRRRKGRDVLPIEVTPELAELVEEAKRLPRKVRSLALITSSLGRQYNERSVSQAFSAAARSVGLADVRFHDLRRSSANAERDTAQARLGHSSERTTRKHYITGRDTVRPIRRKL